MYGHLSIKSARAPYRRAGLAWADREPVEIDIRDLDGDRLRALLLDPVLTISVSNESGKLQLVPESHRALFAEEAHVLIAKAIDALPPLPAEVPEDLVAAELDAVATKLKAAGFDSLDTLLLSHSGADAIVGDQRKALLGIDEMLKDAGFSSLDALVQAHADQAEQLKAALVAHDETKASLATAESRANQLDAEVTKLKGEIEKLKAEKPTAKTKTPRPAGTDT